MKPWIILTAAILTTNLIAPAVFAAPAQPLSGQNDKSKQKSPAKDAPAKHKSGKKKK